MRRRRPARRMKLKTQAVKGVLQRVIKRILSRYSDMPNVKIKELLESRGTEVTEIQIAQVRHRHTEGTERVEGKKKKKANRLEEEKKRRGKIGKQPIVMIIDGKRIPVGTFTPLRPWIIKNGEVVIKRSRRKKPSRAYFNDPKIRTTEARVRRALFENKGKKLIKEIAENTGVSPQYVSEIAKKMLAEEFKIELKDPAESMRKKPTKLTTMQKKALIKAEPFVRDAIKLNLEIYKLTGRYKNEFELMVTISLPNWIRLLTKKNRQYTETDLKKFVGFEVRKVAIKINTKKTKAVLDEKLSHPISLRETGTFIALLSRLGKRKMTVEQALADMKENTQYRMAFQRARELLLKYDWPND